MKVRDVYFPWIARTDRRETLAHAASRMRLLDVGTLAVYESHQLVGVLSERDLTRAVAQGCDPTKLTVGEFMTPEPLTVDADAHVEEAASTMLASGVRHLPVTEGPAVRGMISVRDLLYVVVRGHEQRRGTPGRATR